MGTLRKDRSGTFLYEGKTLEEWVPSVVGRVVGQFDPLKVLLFGSLARGEVNSKSDVDLLVVFDRVERESKRELTAETPVPLDVVEASCQDAVQTVQHVRGIYKTTLEELKRYRYESG